MIKQGREKLRRFSARKGRKRGIKMYSGQERHWR